MAETSNRTARQTGSSAKKEDSKAEEQQVGSGTINTNTDREGNLIKTPDEETGKQLNSEVPGSHTQHTEYVEGAEHVIGTDPRRVPPADGRCMYDGNRIINGKHVDPMGVELDINHKAGTEKGIVPAGADMTHR